MTGRPIRFVIVLSLAVTTGALAVAQNATSSNSDSMNAENVTHTLDQLIQQNQQLEIQNGQMEKQNEQLQKQNEELIEQIKLLRGAGDQHVNGSEQATGAASGQTTAAKTGQQTGQTSGQKQGTQSTQNQTTQSTSQNQSNGDDKAQYPEASNGEPAIFGEFNPGRGFTVGKGEYGELNLSGYMVARFLDQMPAQQTAVDHLGRPIQVTPRKDFQFHRVDHERVAFPTAHRMAGVHGLAQRVFVERPAVGRDHAEVRVTAAAVAATAVDHRDVFIGVEDTPGRALPRNAERLARS